tara:strand:- start:37 stop:180 length:144 start_codon:yes stop_codon:yes gene_type:complete
MKDKTVHTLKCTALGFSVIIFSKPIALCFMIVGDIILNAGDFIKNLF